MTEIQIIALIFIVGLVALFFITYVLNKKTPPPKGCEELALNKEKCSACNNYACQFHEDISDEEGK